MEGGMKIAKMKDKNKQEEKHSRILFYNKKSYLLEI